MLESGIHTLSGNRRASASLSPVLVHFAAPQGKLYQRLLTLEPLFERIPPIAPHARDRLLVSEKTASDLAPSA